MHALFRNSLLAFAIALTLSTGALPSRAQEETEEGETLTRGPIHEAFAEIIEFNPEPGPPIAKAPPELIQELPPDQKPDGENIAWIPGYWAWDEEKGDFIWISGIWRAIPPDRQWVPGYWTSSTEGWRWTAGYWGHAGTPPAYLPTAPPTSLESGPNAPAPSQEHIWVSGTWIYQDHYMWRPGYWEPARAEWTWVPPHYVWTPHGYLFVDGYWDYDVENRGMIFAPVYFPSAVVVHHYSPAVVINLSIFDNCLFVRQHRPHYYFGDYFAVQYHNAGFFAAFSFHSSHRCYDPIFTHQRWSHRNDSGWEGRVAATYRDRRDNPAARPPRTFAESQRRQNNSPAGVQAGRQAAAPIASTLAQAARSQDGNAGNHRFRRLDDNERRDIAQQRYGNGRSRNGAQGQRKPSCQPAPQNQVVAQNQNPGSSRAQTADARTAPRLPGVRSPDKMPVADQKKVPEQLLQSQTGQERTRAQSPDSRTAPRLPSVRSPDQTPVVGQTKGPEQSVQVPTGQERSRSQWQDNGGNRSYSGRQTQVSPQTLHVQEQSPTSLSRFPQSSQFQNSRRENATQPSWQRPPPASRQEPATQRQPAPQAPAPAPVEVRQNADPPQAAAQQSPPNTAPERDRDRSQNNSQQNYYTNQDRNTRSGSSANSQSLRNQQPIQKQQQPQYQQRSQNRQSQWQKQEQGQ